MKGWSKSHIGESGGMGLAKDLFWTKYVDKELKDLPLYYYSVLEAWGFMKIARKTSALSLFWLLALKKIGHL